MGYFYPIMYAVIASLNTEEPIMLLNQPIGIDKDDPMASYIDGALFQNELFELDGSGYKAIKIHINSPGGNVVEGWNICNAILKTRTPVDTYNTGLAASMAATVFMMGRKRIMSDYSALMIHNPFGGDDKKMLGAMRNSLVKMVSAKCKCSEEEVQKMMDKETWMDAEQAFEKGFCTEIEVTSEANRKRMPAASIRAMWEAANEINNNNSKKQVYMSDVNTNTMQAKVVGISLIASYLDLNPDSSEGAVLTGVRNRINTEIVARTKAEEEMEKMKDALAKAEVALASAKKAYDDKCEEMSKKEKEEKDKAEAAAATAAAAIATAAKASAKVIIEKYVAAGRVKADQVDKLIDIAMKTSVEDVTSMLGELPVNREMPASARVDVRDANAKVVDPSKEGMSAVHLMARVKANQNAKLAAEKAN